MVARDVMKTDLVTAHPGDSVRAAAQVMLDRGYGALPVVDDEGKLVGLISETDVLALCIPGYLRETADLSFLPRTFQFPVADGEELDTTTVGEVVRTDILQVVEEDEHLLEVVRIMVQRHVRRCPVVRDGKLIGIISRRDLMQMLVRPIVEGGDAS